MLLHQGCVSYNRIICSKGIQVVLSTFKQNQLDTKGLPFSQGRKPSHKNRWCHQDRLCHQEVEPSVIKIGKGLIATSRLDLLWWKLVMGGSATLQVTSAFPKWIISDKRLPASPRSGSSRISDCQPLLERTSAAPVCSSCLGLKFQLKKQEATFWSLSSKQENGEHNSLQCKLKQVSSKSKEMLSQIFLGEAIYIRFRCRMDFRFS